METKTETDQTGKKNGFDNKYVAGCLVILTGCSLLFQNCSPLKSQKSELASTPIEVQDVSGTTAKVTWAKGWYSPKKTDTYFMRLSPVVQIVSAS